MQIPKDISEIHDRFKKSGKDLYLVGGCVRDFKLGLEPKDFDMATNAYPEEIEHILEGFRFDLTGKNFGVMRVYTEESPKGYEIATYREDETVGRKPKVKVGSTIQNDANRRDITINALYYDIDKKEIIDLVDGTKDLESKTIRACGNPINRISEDALRILRAVRFKNIIGGELESELSKAILANPVLECPDDEGNVVPIAQERISEEFLKGMEKSMNVKTYVQDLYKYQLLGQVFRNMHLNENHMSSKNPTIMIADIVRFNTNLKDVYKKLVDDCKFTKKLAEGVVFLLSVEEIDEDKAYMLRKRMSKTDLTMSDVLDYGNLMTEYGFYHARMKFLKAFTQYEITTSGDELKEKEGFTDGPELGAEIEKRERNNFLSIYNNF